MSFIKPLLRLSTALFCGWLFALGLGLSGMTRPSKVIAFLDLAGPWDPSLALVLIAASASLSLLFPWLTRRPEPLLDDLYFIPRRRVVDRRLMLGAGMFGMGWGLVGYCPGPGLVALVTLKPVVWIFVVAMLVGLHLGRPLSR